MRRALALLTVVGGAAAPSARARDWFPLTGAVVGLAVGAAWWAAAEVWPPAVAAAVAVAVDLVLTGALHADGLFDSADGLLAHLDGPERRLEVMADPAVGAFGVTVGVGVLLLRWSAFASQAPSVLLVAGLWCASRTVMGWTLATARPARPAGLSAAFSAPGGLPPAAVAAAGLGLALVLAGGGRGLAGVVAVGAAVVVAAAVVALGRRRLGGSTGDVLGASGIVGETAGLLVGAARW